jgi:hypothetical protein
MPGPRGKAGLSCEANVENVVSITTQAAYADMARSQVKDR